jgi:hypothetical protein
VIDRGRMLVGDGVYMKSYEVRRTGGGQLGIDDGLVRDGEARAFHLVEYLRFATGSVNGKTPDDTAIGNLADMSEQVAYGLSLFGLARSGAHMLLATAVGGVVYRRDAGFGGAVR